jgi:hypothetical protein
MLANDLMRDLAFSDPVRRLQKAHSNTTDGFAISASYETDFHVIGIYIVGIVMILIVAVACCRIVGTYMARRRITAIDASELPDDKTVNKPAESTLARRKQAILELFETSQVTMVSTNEVDGTLHNKQFRQTQ